MSLRQEGRVVSLAPEVSLACALALSLVACDHDAALARIERELRSGPADPAMAGERADGGDAEQEAAGSDSAPNATGGDPALETAGIQHDPLTLEPNDGFETAAPIELDETHDYLVLTPDSDELDLYRVAVEAGATYTLDIRNPSRCFLTFEVGLGPDGGRATLLARRSTVVNQTGGFQENVRSHVVEEFSSPESGFALVRLESSGLGAGCSRYALTVYRSTSAGLKHDGVSLEPNDSPSMAAPLEYGVARQSMSLTAYVDTSDYFEFAPAVAGDDYTLILDNPQGCALDYAVSVNSAGTPLPVISPASTFRIDGEVERVEQTGAAPADGVLLLEISTYVVSGSCNSYEVLLRHGP